MTEDVVSTREFGDYDVYEELGHGGIGETFVARLKRDTAAGLDRYVCLKIMGREFQAARGDRRQQAIESLRHEARVVAGLNHPNIARLVDSGAYNDVWFVAFELVSGANLDEILAMRRPGEGLEPEHVRRIGIQVAAALQCAHEHHVLHRDVKPGNILIGTDGQVKLVDFGLAKANARASEDFTVGVGTPRYWAPEQILQDTLTEATDLYALGVVLYELLTTVHPSHASTPDGFRRNIVRGQKRPLVEFGVPDDLAMIVECCLDPEPGNRFLSAQALHTALRSGAKVSGFEYEIGQIAHAARDAVAEQRSFGSNSEPGNESQDHAQSTVHASQAGPTKHMGTLAVAAAVREGVPGQAESPTRDEILSDLSRMARDAIRHRESHTQRRRRSTTVAEVAILGRGEAGTREPPTAAESIRARKREGMEPPTAAESVRARKRAATLAEDPFSKTATVETSELTIETRPESAAPPVGAAVTTPEVMAHRPRQVTQHAQSRKRPWVYAVATAALLALLVVVAFVALSPQTSTLTHPPPAPAASQTLASPAAVESSPRTDVPAPPTAASATIPPPVPTTPASKGEREKKTGATAARPDRVSPGDEASPSALRVTIGLIPYGDVVVDGKRVGRSPVTISLRPGKHQVVGRAPGGRSQAKTITVSADSTSFVMDLRDDAKRTP